MEERYTLEELEQYFSIILAIAATEKEMSMKELFSAKKHLTRLWLQ